MVLLFRSIYFKLRDFNVRNSLYTLKFLCHHLSQASTLNRPCIFSQRVGLIMIEASSTFWMACFFWINIWRVQIARALSQAPCIVGGHDCLARPHYNLGANRCDSQYITYSNAFANMLFIRLQTNAYVTKHFFLTFFTLTF